MKPGIYYDMPHKEYHSIDALSRGRLSQLKKSPAHMKYYLDHPEERDSEALILGEALHALVLEPDTFNSRFAVEPEVNKRTKAGREAIETIRQRFPEKTLISPKLWELAIRLAETITLHETIPALLHPCKKEVSLFWERDGVLCKARLDAWDQEFGVIYDVKTCQDASEQGFFRAVRDHDYQMQAHWYLDGLNRLGEKAEKFIWIPIEKKPPYGVSIRECGSGLLSDGKTDIERYFEKYVYCKANDYWPGYSTAPVVLDKHVSYELA